MKPLNSYVIIQVENTEEKSKGGLYVPPGSNVNAKDILQSGTIVGIQESQITKYGVNLGDNVLFNKNAITKIPKCTDKILVRIEDLYMII